MSAVLALDAGTTGVTAVVVADDGRVLTRGYAEFAQHFPAPGQVEHEPDQIWDATLTATRAALEGGDVEVRAVGLTNQRETLVLWDPETLRSPRRALVWQDRRTAALCRRLAEQGHGDEVARATGLRLDPYFTGSKALWLSENEPDTWRAVHDGDLVLGSVDSWLAARLTGGRRHVTEPGNASRTLLYDLGEHAWSDALCELFDVPRAALPEVVPSSDAEAWGRTDPDAFLGLDLPVGGAAGDQQAALFGQACFEPGRGKCTYGTGSFVLVQTGAELVRSERLLTTVAWDLGDGPVHALEGSVFVTGAAVQWLRDGLGVIDDAPEVETLARSVDSSDDVVFVPALAGLGAPHWDPDARGLVVGLTRGTTAAHLARATLEAVAHQVTDCVEAMVDEAHVEVPELTVDGGAAANDLLCEIQAAQLRRPVRRAAELQSTAVGAAFLAGLAVGVWSSTDELADTARVDATFEPGEHDAPGRRRWARAVELSRGWAGPED